MIDRLVVEISRVVTASPSGGHHHEIRIRCSFNGKEYGGRLGLLPPELTSYFEQIWERTGKEIKAAIEADQKGLQATAKVCGICNDERVLIGAYCGKCGALCR